MSLSMNQVVQLLNMARRVSKLEFRKMCIRSMFVEMSIFVRCVDILFMEPENGH